MFVFVPSAGAVPEADDGSVTPAGPGVAASSYESEWRRDRMVADGGLEQAAGLPGRCIVVRVRPGGDLVSALERVCTQHGISAGTIDCCIGSFGECTLEQPAMVRKNGKTVPGFGPSLVLSGPLDIVCAQGTVATRGSGLFIHLHVVVGNDKHQVFAGHLEQQKSTVSATAEVCIREIRGISMSRRYDSDVEGEHLHPEAVGETSSGVPS